MGAKFVRVELLRAVRRIAELRVVDPEIRAGRPFVARPDAITPIVAVGKAAARPSHNRRMELLEGVHQFFADAVVVRYLRVGADPDSVIDNAADIFGEVTIDIWSIVPSGSSSRTVNAVSAADAERGSKRAAARAPANSLLLVGISGLNDELTDALAGSEFGEGGSHVSQREGV